MRVDPDIRKASTLPPAIYTDPGLFALAKERVFARSWQLVADVDQLAVPGQCVPVTLLPGVLDEPLLLTRDQKDRLHAVSNVCTHRGSLVCEGDRVQTSLRCRYHGRRFELDGRFVSMPEFEGVEDFPTETDNLAGVSHAVWHKLVFVSLDPAFPFEDLVAELTERVGFLPLHEAVLDRSRSRDYLVRANWALYCDNYLEGFHIPYVHTGLIGALDYGAYRTELFQRSSLQLGIASGDENIFTIPSHAKDAGLRIAGYYFWLFPNTLLNFYPWGLSVNIVMPLALDRTRIRYLTYVWDPSSLDQGAGSNLDRVEREDETVIESVQTGVRSRLYRGGRFSARREEGVHHFHRMLAGFLNGSGE